MKIKLSTVILLAAVAAVAAGALVYCRFFSKTVIGTYNFPDFTVEKFIRANDDPSVRIEMIPMQEPDRMKKYDFVLVRVHGNVLTDVHYETIRQAISEGVTVYSTDASDSTVNSLSGDELQYVHTLMENGCNANYRSLFKYFTSGQREDPVILPQEYYFHLGDDNFFSTLAEYEQFYKKSGKYREGAPRIAFLAGNINMQNSNEEHFAAIINSLEEKGLNVYPINSFGPGKLKMISDVKPDLIIYRPHGRLVMGGGEAGAEFLKSLGVPILSPVTVSEKYEDWLADAQGMAAGGMTSMSVVLPELDGAVAPYAIAAQFDRNGLLIFDSIPGHTEKFCRLVKNYTVLQDKDNASKRIAIYYYKGMGKGSVSAADIEGVQSLYNTLKLLKDNGYDVSGLPKDAKALEQMIQKQGAVLGPYALGAYDTFLKEGNPELLDTDTFYRWASEELPQELVSQLTERYGQAPGEYMSAESDGKECFAIARIRFGNVVILPQPLPSVGEDVETIVHGTEGAPAYPYVASYLWTRKGFKADAIIHFGTHGSLEFIPGKQLALSDYDWTDALIGDMPHFYIYTVNNIGEGIIAKRRSYAALVSHLTSPFMQGELYGELSILKDRIHNMEVLEEGAVKQNYRETITSMAKSQNILSALGIDTTRVLTDDEIEKVHIYLEEVDGAKVIDGLYVLGEKYSDEEIDNTVRMIMTDPIKYALAGIDVEKGLIKEKDLDNASVLAHRYGMRTEKIISAAMSGEEPSSIIARYSDAADTSDASRSFRDAVSQVAEVRSRLESSTASEQKALLAALDGRYISPGSAGDPIVNPSALPTGKNFYSINPETTPTPEAWKTGKKLAEDLLASEMTLKGEYPQKVSFTLWATDFISSEGATVAQIMHLLGVEPVRDRFGYIRSLKLIPSEELGRPRIDVVVQTSGQLRDIAASRLALINEAVALAATDRSENNYVEKGMKDAERYLLEKGFSPADARKYAGERIFGGTGGNYGTGIMGMVEKGDSWESADEIAERYISNMGALYSSNGTDGWGKEVQGVFEAALLNTSVVVQPRSSNTWGPLSLDHVYEFMGGMSAAVTKVTGNDPTGYFNDFRNTSRARVQGLKEAIGVESSSTVFNPKYIKEMMSGEASAMDHFAETFRNTYGWNAMKPSAIDKHIWDSYYDIYVNDKYDLGIKETFSEKNPYALQEMTAVMLESARKGMWKASPEQIRNVSDLHASLVRDHSAGCSGFICDNAKLRQFISSNIDPQLSESYYQAITDAREVRIDDSRDNMVLEKENKSQTRRNVSEDKGESRGMTYMVLLIFFAAAIVVVIALAIRNRKK